MRHREGRVEVICGGMFCGKTEELIRRLRRAIIARQNVQVFKPRIDNRYSLNEVTSHNGQNIEAQIIDEPQDILNALDEQTTVVAIDEIQFLDRTIISVINQLIDKQIRVIAAGLDTDFRGEPFGCVPHLMAQAEEVTKLRAICMTCGEPASRTQRLVNGKPAHYDDPIILVGAKETYEPRCRKHHQVPRQERQHPVGTNHNQNEH